MNGGHCATSELGEIGSQTEFRANQVGHVVLSTIVHGFDPVWSTFFIRLDLMCQSLPDNGDMRKKVR